MDFVTRYYDLLADIKDYFKDAFITDVLEHVDDNTCKMLRDRMQ